MSIYLIEETSIKSLKFSYFSSGIEKNNGNVSIKDLMISMKIRKIKQSKWKENLKSSSNRFQFHACKKINWHYLDYRIQLS